MVRVTQSQSAGKADPIGSRPPAEPPRRGEPLGFTFDPVHRGLREDVRPGRLKPIDVLVVAILLSFRRHRKDSCWACKATIAARLHRAAKTIQRSLARLEACGWIRQAAVPVPDPDEPRNRTGWRIVFTWLVDPAIDFGPRPDRRNPFERKKLRPDGGQECPPPEDRNVLPPEDQNVLPPPGPKCPPREIVVVTEMEPTEMEPTESPPEVSVPVERQRPGPDAKAVPPVPTVRAEPPPVPPAAGPLAAVLGRICPELVAPGAPARPLAAAPSDPPPAARETPPDPRPAPSPAVPAPIARAIPPAAGELSAAQQSRLAELAEEHPATHAQVLEWLALGDPIMHGEAMRLLAPKPTRTQAPPPATTAELLARIREDRLFVTEGSKRLAFEFEGSGDMRYWNAYLKELTDAYEGRLEPAALVEAHRQAMGPDAKNRGAVFKTALDRLRGRRLEPGGIP